MLEWTLGGIRWRLSLLFPTIWIVLLSVDTTGMTALCLAASMIHELGHGIAMFCFHDRPCCVTCGVFGIRIERHPTQRLSYGAQGIIALAGPLTNAFGAAVFAVCGFASAATIHTLLAILHALPVLSLDGGEALYACLCHHLPEPRAEQVLLWCSVVTVFPLAAIGWYLLLADGHNFTLLLLSVYLILRMFLRKGH